MVGTSLGGENLAPGAIGSRIFVFPVASARPPAFVADAELRERLRHIHDTQRSFLDLWTGQPIGRNEAARIPTLPELYAWARPYYTQVHAFPAGLTDADLATPTPVPWARHFNRRMGAEPAVTTLGETLFQVTSHSTYHRGQVNLRLRALRVTPPLVDYIAWVWQRRPPPVWLGVRPSGPGRDGT
jgi:uncharacterized damage-inducible protein DinB